MVAEAARKGFLHRGHVGPRMGSDSKKCVGPMSANEQQPEAEDSSVATPGARWPSVQRRQLTRIGLAGCVSIRCTALPQPRHGCRERESNCIQTLAESHPAAHHDWGLPCPSVHTAAQLLPCRLECFSTSARPVRHGQQSEVTSPLEWMSWLPLTF